MLMVLAVVCCLFWVKKSLLGAKIDRYNCKGNDFSPKKCKNLDKKS